MILNIFNKKLLYIASSLDRLSNILDYTIIPFERL